MTMLTAQVEQARITITIDFKPCPFCGSDDLAVFTTSAECYQDVDFIDCGGCSATAPANVWNKAPRPETLPRRRKPLP